jgi:ribA/ribD-fused uncharacterized protein
MEKIEIRKIGITRLDTDAIVNAANEGLQAGGGVCGAIFKEAGYRRLQDACDEIGHCKTGHAVVTPGFDLKAKYIIHAVGPVWRGGGNGEREELYSAYTESLKLASKVGCSSIGFPLISAGIFGYPKRQAWETAVAGCMDFMNQNPDTDIRIVFAVLDDEIMKIGLEVLEAAGQKNAQVVTKDDWKTVDMPAMNERFEFCRPFTDHQMEILRGGHIPQEMEDKWFWYMEGSTLYAHRSWTGFCIYKVDFKPDNKHLVTVNRDPEQYTCTSTKADAEQLNDLFNWWVQDQYDYYNEWLSETVKTLEKSGMLKERLKINDREYDAVYFHRPEEPNGYLSNWFASDFDLDGIHYTSAEQYIMYQKCMLFGDRTSAEAVLATKDVALQQKIGRNARGYIGNVWSGARQAIAMRGLYAKFSQNIDLREMLLNTGDAYLVECAGSDKVWACGIRLSDDQRLDASNWTGENILGFALMEVRERLRNAD